MPATFKWNLKIQQKQEPMRMKLIHFYNTNVRLLLIKILRINVAPNLGIIQTPREKKLLENAPGNKSRVSNKS